MANYPGIFQDASGNNILPTPNSYANTIETGNTASQAYVKGAPVLRNVPGGDTNKNGLFRAKTAIASGATFTVGTNIEKVNVGDLANQVWANGNAFYLDYQNGSYGFNTSASRGADTFSPFSGAGKYTYVIPKCVSPGYYEGSVIRKLDGTIVTLTGTNLNYDYFVNFVKNNWDYVSDFSLYSQDSNSAYFRGTVAKSGMHLFSSDEATRSSAVRSSGYVFTVTAVKSGNSFTAIAFE